MSADGEIEMTPQERLDAVVDVLTEALWRLIISGRAREIIEERGLDKPNAEQRPPDAAQPSSLADPATTTKGPRVVMGYIQRTRRGLKITKEPPTIEAPKPTRRPARVAQTLALAHRFQRAIDKGEYRDQAELARQLGFSRARITQIMNLAYLAPDLQEEILFMEAVDGKEPISERDLRPVTRTMSWPEQRELWAHVVPTLCQRA